VFRSAYLGNRIDKLFGYQSYLQATLAERLNSHRLGVISLSLLPIVWRFRLAERLNTQAMLVLVLPFCLLFGEIKLLPLSL